MTKLFVGGLPFSVTSQQLEELFATYGQIQSAQVISDRYTNQSRGFGFVEMADENAAQEAVKALDGSDLEGRKINVSVARPKEERSTGGFGGGRDNRNKGGIRY